MKTFGLALATAAAILVTSCSTLKVTTDFKQGADFSSYKTFAFKDVEKVQNPIINDRIKSAVAAQLVAKGMTAKEDSPDVWVVLHPRLSKQTQINTYDSGWGYGYRGMRGGMGGTSTSTVTEIPIGTLVVDLVDVKAKELVWRGTASDSLADSPTPEERVKNINAAMAKLFEGFPPKK